MFHIVNVIQIFKKKELSSILLRRILFFFVQFKFFCRIYQWKLKEHDKNWVLVYSHCSILKILFSFFLPFFSIQVIPSIPSIPKYIARVFSVLCKCSLLLYCACIHGNPLCMQILWRLVMTISPEGFFQTFKPGACLPLTWKLFLKLSLISPPRNIHCF